MNNQGFELQKSFDGTSWGTLSFIMGSGTTNNIQSYSYTDYESSKCYYRLKQIDYDGVYEYSNTIAVNKSVRQLEKIDVYTQTGHLYLLILI